MLKHTAFVAILVIAACGYTAAQGSDDVTFKSLIKQMTEAQTEFDAAALGKIYTADYIEVSPAGELDDRAKVLGFYKPELKPDRSKMSVAVEASEHSIRNYGATAVVITKLTFLVTSDGRQAPQRSMRATIVFRKVGGQWKIASSQYTGIRPAAVKPPEK